MSLSSVSRRCVALLVAACVCAAAVASSSAKADAGAIDDRTLLENSQLRRSPSQFALYNANSDSSASAGRRRGAPEDAIVRTAGTGCVQSAGSTVNCDLCCNGVCCENPAHWPAPSASSSLAQAQIWVPLRFAFVVPASYAVNTLPTVAQQKTLVTKANQALAQLPIRVLYTGHDVYANDTLHGHCNTDPCFTDPNCGFFKTLLANLNTTGADREIVVTVCQGITYGGEAQFPWGSPRAQYVQLQLESFDTPVIVHELGHYVGLLHVFEGECTDMGDWVADTAPARTANSDCRSGRDSCTGQAGVDDVLNFMNYGLRWDCGMSFGPGQATRALLALQHFRPTLIANTRVNLTASGAPGSVTPACSTTAAVFSDCWCSEPHLDPANWCRTAAANSVTFTTGATPAPPVPTPAPTSGAAGLRAVASVVVVVVAMLMALLSGM